MDSSIFNSIPAALRVPGVYIEFDNSLAGNTVIAHKILVLGQRLTTGTVAEGVPTRVLSESAAEEYFGRGSQLAEMLKAMKAADRFMEVWAIGLDDDAAGEPATGAISTTGTATEAGTLVVYIAGKAVKVAVASGDTGDTVATALAAAITADTTLPVTAVVNGTTTTQVDLTARHAGEVGNDIDLRKNYYGEKTPAGLLVAFTAMSGGTTNPDIGTAIASFGQEWWNWIVCPWNDTANLTTLATELDSRWGPLVQKGARAFTAFRGSHADTATHTSALNSPHITCMGTNSSPTPAYIWAAVNAVVGGSKLSIDPARPLQTLALPGIMAPALEARWTDAERNLHLYDGAATYTVGSDGTVRIERQITTYQENAAGVADDSYLDINTPETLERIRYEQRSLFLLKYPRHKLAADDTRAGAGQPIMMPKIARAELLSLYTDMEARGWVQDYDGYKNALLVDIDPNDPTRLNVQDSPQLVGQYRVHAQQVQFRR